MYIPNSYIIVNKKIQSTEQITRDQFEMFAFNEFYLYNYEDQIDKSVFEIRSFEDLKKHFMQFVILAFYLLTNFK